MLSSNKNKKHPDKNIYLMDKNLITVTSPLLPDLDDFTAELKKI